jgi:sialate O-acetylesterase
MRKAMLATLVVVALAACQTPRAEAEVKLHGLFTDNMVLQRDMPARIWGTADPGEPLRMSISWSFSDKAKKADRSGEVYATPGPGQMVFSVDKTDKDGKWMCTLGSLKTGGPYTITISGKGNSVTLKNVMVGEVWIASGQSNMEWELYKTRNPDEVAAKSKNPKIRYFDVPKTPKQTAQTDLGDVAEMKKPPAKRTFGKWLECDPSTVPGFSAVGYYFGRALQRDLDVPVGIINSSWGGTHAERWTSKATFDSTPELQGLKGSDLYNGMIVPLQPFAFRGVIWYQGEGNAPQAKQYFYLMNAMIKSWRDDWKQGDFPFLTTQLAGWDQPKVEGEWALLREAQLFTSLKVKNTAMAVTTDIGDPEDIHPKDKEPVGERLARAAKALAYGQKVEYIGPQFDSLKFDGEKAVLTFKHIGGGLMAKGGPLTGFTIAGKDGKFVKAEANIVENTVVVRSPEVPNPVAVRYGWANFPVVNLYSREGGLPASPFRTDVPEFYK